MHEAKIVTTDVQKYAGSRPFTRRIWHGDCFCNGPLLAKLNYPQHHCFERSAAMHTQLDARAAFGIYFAVVIALMSAEGGQAQACTAEELRECSRTWRSLEC